MTLCCGSVCLGARIPPLTAGGADPPLPLPARAAHQPALFRQARTAISMLTLDK